MEITDYQVIILFILIHLDRFLIFNYNLLLFSFY